MKRELKVKEMHLQDATRRRFLKLQQDQREMELGRLNDEIERKVYESSLSAHTWSPFTLTQCHDHLQVKGYCQDPKGILNSPFDFIYFFPQLFPIFHISLIVKDFRNVRKISQFDWCP